MGIIPSLDELKNGQACLGLGVKTATVKQFTFERGEEAFAQRVVKAVSD